MPTVERQQKMLLKIDLSGLISKQWEIARNAIREEWEELSKREMMMCKKIEPIQ